MRPQGRNVAEGHYEAAQTMVAPAAQQITQHRGSCQNMGKTGFCKFDYTTGPREGRHGFGASTVTDSKPNHLLTSSNPI